MNGFFLEKNERFRKFWNLKRKIDKKKRKNIYKLNNLIKDVLYE